MSLIYNATFDSQTRVLSLLDKAGNVISSCEVPSKELVDDIRKPLTFRATQDGSTVTLKKNGSPSGAFQTSTDGGNTWTNYTIGTAITLNTSDEVSFRAKANRTADQTSLRYFYFEMKGKIEAWHNVMSLYRTNDFATYDTVAEYAFYSLFDGCTSLVKAPALPATTLAQQCYSYMFRGCQSLIKAPELPATTLSGSCYSRMFDGCQSLTEAPVLPATTLASNCYYGMFLGCDRLNEVRCQLPSTISAGDVSSYTGSVTDAWLYSAPSTGTFYTNADANWPTGVSGIPTGWTRVNEGAPTVDDITKPLTFRATQDGSTVKLKKEGTPEGAFQTSRDGGNTWSDYTIGTAIALNTGEEVSFRAKSDRTSTTYSGSYFQFNMTGKIEAWHNVMSLYRTNDFATYESVMKHAFINLFKDCTSLVKAPALPATTLSEDCYSNMFDGCQSLTKAPELPATTLARFCYWEMFSGCQSLNEVRIAATTTEYNALFNWLSGVSATGDFYCDPNATIFPTDSTSGIPKNWTRHNIADYPN